MEKIKTIPPEVAVLIPKMQLEYTMENLSGLSDEVYSYMPDCANAPE